MIYLLNPKAKYFRNTCIEATADEWAAGAEEEVEEGEVKIFIFD